MRKWQVEACDGERCAALLLSFFEYWHNIKLALREKAIAANDVAENHGDERTQDESLYQFHTEKELEDGLLGLYGKTKIKDALDVLVQKNFISIHKNPNINYKFDRTRHFLFYPEAVNSWMVVHRSAENGARQAENGSPSAENGLTIPEITSEITTESKDHVGQQKQADLPSPPYNQIVDLYHQICTPPLPKIRELNSSRQQAIRNRWNKNPDIKYFAELFKRVTKSDFLAGRTDRPWNGCNLDWMMKLQNFNKILEGNYDNKDRPKTPPPPKLRGTAEVEADRQRILRGE